ncbi:MAG: hypothetical protein MPJ22_10760, partial [Pirellulales bacterium]|nr:hypothetical protein [Pirellulales bacterium]
AVMIARYLILSSRGAAITLGVSQADGATVQTNIEAGVPGPMDVDTSGNNANNLDAVMIARYLILSSRGAAITQGVSQADGATVQAAIESLF